LTILSDDGARLFNQRLEMLLATSASLKAHFADHEAAGARLQALVAGHVDDAQARVAAFGDDGLAATDRLVERIEAIHARAAELGGPIASTKAAVTGLEDAAEALGQKVADVDEVLNARLAAMRAAMAALETETQRVFDSVAGLGKSVDEGSGLVADAADALAAQRDEVVRLAADLAGHFDTARAALADLEGGSVAAAASVEAAAARAAGTGQDAAERLAGHMLRLVETVDTVEMRMREVETRFAVRARDSLSRRSAALIRQLQAGAVDAAKLLSITVGEDEWARYLKGDRGVFARAVADRLDGETGRQICQMFDDDADFRADAVRFCDVFEALLIRLLGDDDGDALATMMLSSDLGKLYIALAAAAGRTPPAG
jgi:hypothetical protein